MKSMFLQVSNKLKKIEIIKKKTDGHFWKWAGSAKESRQSANQERRMATLIN